MAEATLRVFSRRSNDGKTIDYRVPVAPAWLSWTRSITFRGTSLRTSPSAGTAKRGSVAPAPRKSTAVPA